MNSTHTWSCWQDFICGKNGLQCVFLATFFPWQYWESPVDTSISATKYITLDSIHYTCFLTWPHMAQGYCQDPGQDKMEWGICLIPDRVLLIVSLQELGGIISVYSDQEKLLRPPGGTTADCWPPEYCRDGFHCHKTATNCSHIQTPWGERFRSKLFWQ